MTATPCHTDPKAPPHMRTHNDGTRDHLTGFDVMAKRMFCFDCGWAMPSSNDGFIEAKEHQMNNRTANPDPRGQRR